MANIQEFTLSLLSAAGVSAALSGAVIWLARNWIGERLRNSIKHEYDLKLSALNNELRTQADAQAAQLKASIEREAEKIRFATSSIGESQKAAITRKLDGIDTLWTGVLSARENVPAIMSFIDILTVDQYLSMGDHSDFKQLVGDLSPEKLAKMFKDNVGSLERVRPYVGEYLWAVFSTYQALITHVVLLIQMGEKDPQKLNWHKDSGIRQLLASSLTEQEVAEFEGTQIGKVGWLQRNYEAKIIQAMQKVISGQEFGEEALKQAQEMEAKIQQLKQQNE
ncbi:MAG: hypothetical protein Q8K51_14320 [Nitrospirota bacterium]|nr:hypothetical protein [Nitrospirota bacterium]